MREGKEAKEWLREAEESRWGLRGRRRNSIEEEMIAQVLGRERGAEDDDKPRVDGAATDDHEESGAGAEETSSGRTAHE
jgi:hypothetical protein